MFTSIAGKSVVLTGASKGIGRGIAYKFAALGAKLFLINRNEKDGKALAEHLHNKGYQAYSFAADISCEEEMLNAAKYLGDTLGSVDIVCANAGIYPCVPLESLTVKEWDETFNINLKGTFLTVKSFLPYLKQVKDGRIIITSSITGPETGFPGWSHYGATKAGQLGFMRSAALELAPYGITINAILPGNIMTEGVAEMGEEHIARMAKAIPMKRLGHVDDIANTALFLASKEAGYITGQTIVVDGGQLLPETLESVDY